jgi:hypothetical protein
MPGRRSGVPFTPFHKYLRAASPAFRFRRRVRPARRRLAEVALSLAVRCAYAGNLAALAEDDS